MPEPVSTAKSGVLAKLIPPLYANNAVWFLIAVVVIILDQWSKLSIEAALQYGQRIEVLPIFNLTLAYNPGAAFSFLADAGGWQRWFFTGIAIVASVVLSIWVLSLKNQRWLAVALSLVLGGALGNLYDRIAYGHVIDFLDFHYANTHFPAFNIADSAITAGAIMLIIDMLLEWKREIQLKREKGND